MTPKMPYPCGTAFLLDSNDKNVTTKEQDRQLLWRLRLRIASQVFWRRRVEHLTGIALMAILQQRDFLVGCKALKVKRSKPVRMYSQPQVYQ